MYSRPEIPQNTGNIRTCANTGAILHLIRPLGFSLEDKHLKRCGLRLLGYFRKDIMIALRNYKKNIQMQNIFIQQLANKAHSDMEFEDGCFLVFGKRNKGFKTFNRSKYETCMRIPMLKLEKARSLNLSNSVAIVVYEAMRQIDIQEWDNNFKTKE